ncbi:MAG: hypothetical protein AAGC74_00720 [Verrucomicrobiota bacterium]
MTRSGYIVARILSAFGVSPIKQIRNSAAFEGQLLRESEEVLGQLTWEHVETVPDLTTEYWQLRKLSKKHNDLHSRVNELLDSLEETQDARTSALEEVTLLTREKVDTRDRIADEIESHQEQLEEILRKGRGIKRSHEGLKAKLEVLLDEPDDYAAEIKKTKLELKALKTEFENIKNTKRELSEQVAQLSKELTEITSVIEEDNASVRARAENQFSDIGKANKELTTLRSDLASVEEDCIVIFKVIGRFLIENSKEPEVAEVVRPHLRLIKLIHNLRDSIRRQNSLV